MSISIDALRSYVEKIAKKVLNDESSKPVISGTIKSSLPGIYEVQLVNGNETSLIRAESLYADKTFAVDDYVYLVRAENNRGDEYETKYFIVGLVTTVEQNFANLTEWERFLGDGQKINPTFDTETDVIDINDANFINAIRANGVFSFSAKVSTKIADQTDFGFKFTFTFDDDTTKEEPFPGITFVGQPWNLNEVIQKKIFDLGTQNTLKSIKITKVGPTNEKFSATDISLESGTFLDLAQDFKVTLENVKGKNYFNKSDNNGAIQIKANVNYGNQKLDTKALKYYWFVKKDNATKINSLGGNDWECLNDSHPAKIIDGNGITERKDVLIYKTDDNILEITYDDANTKNWLPHYENEIKCVVGYQLANATSEPIKIYNFNHESYEVTIKFSDDTELPLLYLEETAKINATLNQKLVGLTSNDIYYRWYLNDETEPLSYIKETEDDDGNVKEQTIYYSDSSLVVGYPEKSSKEVYRLSGEYGNFTCKVFKNDGSNEVIADAPPALRVWSAIAADKQLKEEKHYVYWLDVANNLRFSSFEENAKIQNEIDTKYIIYKANGETPGTVVPGIDENAFDWLNGSDPFTENGVYYLYYSEQVQVKSTLESDPNVVYRYNDFSSPQILRHVERKTEKDGKIEVIDLLNYGKIEQLNTFNRLSNNGLSNGIYYNDVKSKYEKTKDTAPVSNKLATGKGYYKKVKTYEYQKVDINEFEDNEDYYIKNANDEYEKIGAFDKEKEYYIRKLVKTEYILREKNSENYDMSISGKEPQNFKSGEEYYEQIEGGDLYINASFIRAGHLEVSDGTTDGTVFSADIDNKTVKIGGFHVTKDHLASGEAVTTDAHSVLISPGYGEDNYDGKFAFWAGDRTGATDDTRPFWVKNSGKIRATGGTIGGFELNDNQIKSTNNNIILNSNGTGIIANFKFDGSRLYSDNENVLISPDYQPDGAITSFAFWAGSCANGSTDNDTRPFWVKTNGKIKATSGSIGGWTIASDLGPTASEPGLYYHDEDNECSTGMANVKGGDVVAFWAGCNKKSPWETNADTKFYVTNNGRLYARDADIEGVINSKAGGKIGPFNINNDGLSSDHIVLNSTSIVFPTQSLFNLANYVKIYHGDSSGTSNNNNDTSYIVTTGEQHFEIKNYGGAGIRFNKTPIDQQISQTVVLSNFMGITTTEGPTNIHGYNYYRHKHYVKFDYVVGAKESDVLPTALSISIDFKCKFGSIYGEKTETATITIPSGVHSGNTAYLYYTEAMTMGSKPDKNYYYINCKLSTSSTWGAPLTTTVPSMTGNNNVLYSLGSFCPHVPDGSNKTTTYVLGDDNHIWGGLRAAVTSQTNSDSRLKNTIVNIPIEYEQFFNSLRPVSFKYNQNTSDRKHLGFIAQEVENSLNNAGIITKDFAGVCIGADSEKTYSLRYEEFIPLNTWEIQKLKKRVSELESELKEIKGDK